MNIYAIHHQLHFNTETFTSLYRIDLDHYGCVHEELISNYGIDCNVTELAETMRSEEVGQGLLAYLDFSYCGRF